MMISTEDMKSCIPEWYAQALNYEDLFEIHYAVQSEANKQAVFVANEIAKRELTNG